MNLTVQSAIQRIEARAGNFTIQAGGIENAIERAELTESLATVRRNLVTISTVLDELQTASASLESNGFNDQWFDIWNANGNLLETINVDLMDLLGTDQEKAEVCMEGLGETIWNWVKRALRWIVEMFNKICTWLKNIMYVWNRDIDVQKKLLIVMEALRGADMVSICQDIDENKAISNNQGILDIRELANRIQIENMILNRILYAHDNIYGFDYTLGATDPNRLFNAEFINYVTRTPEDHLVNPELKSIFADIAAFDSKFDTVIQIVPSSNGKSFDLKNVPTPPLHLFSQGQFATTEYTAASTSNIKEQLKRCGITIGNNGKQVTFEISDADSLPRIRYSDTYFKLADIQSVCKACIDIHETVNKCTASHNSGIGKYKKEIMDAMGAFDRYQNQLKDLKINHSKDPNFVNESYKMTKISSVFSHYAKWVSETVAIMSRMTLDIARCRSIIRLVSTNVGQVLVNHVGDKNKK